MGWSKWLIPDCQFKKKYIKRKKKGEKNIVNCAPKWRKIKQKKINTKNNLLVPAAAVASRPSLSPPLITDFFFSRSRVSFSALTLSKEGGGGPCYCCYCCCCCCCCYCCCCCGCCSSRSETGGWGVNYSSYCYYYYCYYYFCSPIIRRALNIITPLTGLSLVGRAPDIISFIFYFPSVGKGINPERSRGWGILIFSPKFI